MQRQHQVAESSSSHAIYPWRMNVKILQANSWRIHIMQPPGRHAPRSQIPAVNPVQPGKPPHFVSQDVPFIWQRERQWIAQSILQQSRAVPIDPAPDRFPFRDLPHSG